MQFSTIKFLYKCEKFGPSLYFSVVKFVKLSMNLSHRCKTYNELNSVFEKLAIKLILWEEGTISTIVLLGCV